MDAIFFFVTPVILGVVLGALKGRTKVQLLAVFAHFWIQAALAGLVYRSEVDAGFINAWCIPLFYGVPTAVLLCVMAPKSLRMRPLAVGLLTPVVLIGGYATMTSLLIYAGWMKP